MSTPNNSRCGKIVRLRVTTKQKLLIDRAADALGRSRSDFMLSTAYREAASVLLDRRFFAVSEGVFKRFTSMLDRPPEDNPMLLRLLRTNPPWDT
jgi:uncharacterized protein (DUF1778 family)